MWRQHLQVSGSAKHTMFAVAKADNIVQVIELWHKNGAGEGSDNCFVKVYYNGEELELPGSSPGKSFRLKACMKTFEMQKLQLSALPACFSIDYSSQSTPLLKAEGRPRG